MNVPHVRNLLSDFNVQFDIYGLLLDQMIGNVQEGTLQTQPLIS